MITFVQFALAEAEADQFHKVLSHFGYQRQGDAWTHPKLGSTVRTSDSNWTHQGAGNAKNGRSARGLEAHLTATHQTTMFDSPAPTGAPKKPASAKDKALAKKIVPDHSHQLSMFEAEDPEHFESAEHLRKHFTTKHPGTSVDFHDSANHNHSSLGMIKVPKEHQKKGIGSNIMKAISKYADHHQRTVSLSPEKRPGGPSKSKLEDWYKTHGYVHNKGRNKDFRFSDTMIRTPKPKSLSEASHHVMWAMPKNKLEFKKSSLGQQGLPDKSLHRTHEDWFKHDKIPERHWEDIPRGRSIARTGTKEIEHLHYGHGVPDAVKQHMEKQYPGFTHKLSSYPHKVKRSGD